MAEENDVQIKIIETRKIPVDKIEISNIQARQKDVTKKLDIFAEQIRNIGLIQPIVVYPNKDKFELIVGQRRYFAHRDVLKWNEILAMIIEKPADDMMTTTISWIENEARLKMPIQDKMRFVTNLSTLGWKIKDIADHLGINTEEVRSCIGLPRVPNVVREAVQSGEIDPVIALRATDAKKFDKYTTSEDAGADVLDLAKLIQQNKLNKKQQNNLVDYGKENPDTNNDTLIADGIKNITESIHIDLQSSDIKRLERYTENNSYKTKSDAASQLILEGLDQSGD